MKHVKLYLLLFSIALLTSCSNYEIENGVLIEYNGKDSFINIPNNVTSIGDYAFSGCKNLTNIIIPNSVTSIGQFAFSNCKNLTSITIPESVINIGATNFKSLNKNLLINGSKLNDFFIWNNTLIEYLGTDSKVVIPDDIKTLGMLSFESSSITSVFIPDSVTCIGRGAFVKCSNLSEVTISNNVTSIERSAFESCYNLESITIPDSVTNIGIWAFANCTKLSSIIIPSSVTSIEDQAFSGCTNLTEITIPTSIKNIGSDLFGDIPNGLIINGNKSDFFIWDNKLINYFGTDSHVVIPEGVTTLGGYSLSGNKINSVIIPNSVTHIEGSTFFGSNLTSIHIPQSVSVIDKDAFNFCTNLKSIELPKKINNELELGLPLSCRVHYY